MWNLKCARKFIIIRKNVNAFVAFHLAKKTEFLRKFDWTSDICFLRYRHLYGIGTVPVPVRYSTCTGKVLYRYRYGTVWAHYLPYNESSIRVKILRRRLTLDKYKGIINIKKEYKKNTFQVGILNFNF
jgi:hypothetical protein